MELFFKSGLDLLGVGFFYILCGGVIGIGVIFIILGLTRRKKISHSSGSSGGNVYAAVPVQGGENGLTVQSQGPWPLPRELSDDYLNKMMLRLFESPNWLDQYFVTLQMKYHAKREINMIDAARNRWEAIRSMTESEADAYLARAKAHDAKTDYLVSKMPDYQRARAYRKVLEVEADINKLKTGMIGATASDSEPEPVRKTREQIRGEMINDLMSFVEDEIAKQEAIATCLVKLDERKRLWQQDILNNQNIYKEDQERLIEDIDSIYMNLRDKIFNAKPRRSG